MKTKVLIWWARDGGTAEQMLNDWLSQNSKIDIVNVSQSESGDVIASRRITYTIWYR
jgi:hypothetical protein